VSDFFYSEIRCARYKQQTYNPFNKMSTTHEELREQAINILEQIEDTVEYICDENLLSGEKVWVMIHALSEAKLEEFPLDDDTPA